MAVLAILAVSLMSWARDDNFPLSLLSQSQAQDLSVPAYGTEIALYERTRPACHGPHAAKAVDVGFSRFHAWRTAYDAGDEPPKTAFRDAADAFAYLYDELGCRNPMVIYAHARIFRLLENRERTREILAPVYQDLEAALPERAYSIAYTMGSIADDDAEAVDHYGRAIENNPYDANSRLNRITHLIRLKRYAQACDAVLEAWEYPLSSYGYGVLRTMNGTVVDHYPRCAEKARERSR